MAKTRRKPKFRKVIQVGAATGTIYRNPHRSRKLADGGVRYVYTAVAGRKPNVWQKQGAALEEVESELRLHLDKVNAGQVEAAGMTRADRDELIAVRAIAGDIPPTVALKEWRHEQERRAIAKLGCEPVSVEAAINTFIKEGMRAGRQHERTYRSKLVSLLLPTAPNPACPDDKERRLPAPDSFVGRHLNTIGAAELAARLDTFADAVTRNDYRKKSIALWRWAQKRGHIPQEQRLAPELTIRADEPPPPVGICTPKTYAQLLMYLEDYHADLLVAAVLAGHCGMRADEIHGKRQTPKLGDDYARQRWDDIHLRPEDPEEAPFLNVTCAKRNTPKWRTVPLSPAAIAWLEVIPEAQRAGYVCSRFAMDRVRAIGKARGLQLPDNCFRHALISFRIAVEKDKAAVATDCGTSVKKIDSNYRRPVSHADALEWQRLTPLHCRQKYPALEQPSPAECGALGGASTTPAKIAAVTANLVAARAAKAAPSAK